MLLLRAEVLNRSHEHLSCEWDKAHTKSAALYTGVTETETTPLAAPRGARQDVRKCRKGCAPAISIMPALTGYPDAS